MKKHFLKAVLPVLAGVALLFSACEPEGYVYPGQTEVKNAILVGNAGSISGGGVQVAGGEFGAATEIEKSKLEEAGGAIRALRVEVSGASEVTVFISTELDGTPLAVKTVPATDGGWVYAEFDEPYIFKNDNVEKYYIGYTCNFGNNYGVAGFQGGQRRYATEYALLGEWYNCNELYSMSQGYTNLPGRFSIQAVVDGGDYSNITDDVDLAVQASAPVVAETGATVNVLAYVSNIGKRSIPGFKVEWTVGGKTQSQTFNEEMLVGQSKLVQLTATAPTVTGYKVVDNVSVVATAIVGSNASDNNEFATILNVYGTVGEKRNVVVIEQFTGQSCGNCPGGASSLQKAIDAMSDPSKVIWVAHHAGYYPDDFTLSESSTLASWLQVGGAPMMDLNRIYTEYGMIYHPSYTTTAMLEDALNTPTPVTMNELDVNYDATSKKLDVKVTGKSDYDGQIKINVLVLQDGFEAYQNGATGNYTHNHVPCLFLTAALGDALTVAEDGTYSWEGFGTVPATVGSGSFKTVPEDMYVVAYVTIDGEVSLANIDVLNGAKAPLIEGTEVDEPETPETEAKIIAPFNVCAAE